MNTCHGCVVVRQYIYIYIYKVHVAFLLCCCILCWMFTGVKDLFMQVLIMKISNEAQLPEYKLYTFLQTICKGDVSQNWWIRNTLSWQFSSMKHKAMHYWMTLMEETKEVVEWNGWTPPQVKKVTEYYWSVGIEVHMGTSESSKTHCIRKR